jgi:hypothetical protein
MSSLTATYNLNAASLVPWFDKAIQFPVDALAVLKFGNQWDAIHAEVTQLPAAVTAVNYQDVETRIRTIISLLKASRLYAETPAIQTEVVTIENTLTTGVAVAPSKLQWATTKLYNCVVFWKWFSQPAPAVQTLHVSTALPRIKALTTFNASQQHRLASQPRSGANVFDFTSRFSYELKAQIFNYSTLMMIRAVAYGVLGIMGFKTMVITTLAFYALRQVADQSMSLTNFDNWTKVPVIVPVAIPYVPVIDAYAIPGLNIGIPTWKGVKQLAAKAYVYGANFFHNGGAWKPNCLEINGIVVLKNGIVPLKDYPKLFHSALTG